MATASRIVLTPDMDTEYSVPSLSKESAERALKVLQDNHEKHDIIFNDFGLHSRSLFHMAASLCLWLMQLPQTKHADGLLQIT